ncbi:hypothetical protein Tco_0023296, partial [Tanacetum coccineum]
MLKDIRVLCMERLQKMREKHAKWNDGIYPNIRKKLEKYKDLHRSFQVVRAASIYFLHKDPENYVSNWYNKDVFVNAYNHYIEGMNGMDQWPTTDYQKPLPPVVRRMPGRPPHKKRDESKPEGTPSVGKVTTAGEIVSAGVGKVTAASEIVSASGGNVTATGELVSASGGNVTARGGKVSARGGKVTARGGKVFARGGKVTSTPSTPPPGFEMSTPNTASSAIKIREGAWIRSPEKERSSYADSGSSRINKLRTVNGK